MNYKEGDKVIIRSLKWYNENKDEYGTIIFSTESGDYSFTKEDARFCGRVVTIVYEGDGHYLIAEDDRGYFWIDEMIKGPSTSKYNEGDFVGVYGYETDVRIEEVRWDGVSYSYKAYLADEEEWLDDDDIAYKEETYDFLASDKPKPSLNSFMDMLDNEIKLPDGYVFKDENGNVINTTKISLERKKIEHPKTYEECCKILGCKANHFFTNFSYNGCDVEISDYENKIDDLLQTFRKLRYCRDAYWKLAGEEMGLNKPWEPDYNDLNNTMYGLYDELKYSIINPSQFVFPSKEMRDEFAKNFKKDIDSCK